MTTYPYLLQPCSLATLSCHHAYIQTTLLPVLHILERSYKLPVILNDLPKDLHQKVFSLLYYFGRWFCCGATDLLHISDVAQRCPYWREVGFHDLKPIKLD